MNKSRNATTDIKFLCTPRIEPRNQIIYLYQKVSGVLRFKVRDCVREFAKRKEWMPISPAGTLRGALSSQSVFDKLPFIEADCRTVRTGGTSF
ncbi:MAG TPA: hypothetical protein VIE65_17600, partial [Methylobacter sp.]